MHVYRGLQPRSPRFGTDEQIWNRRTNLCGQDSREHHVKLPLPLLRMRVSCGVLVKVSLPHKQTKMSLDTFIAEAKKRIFEDGFFIMEDPEIGSSIEEMKAKQLSFDFSDEAGFNFCRERVLLNSVSLYSHVMVQI
jgi:hypothetical protein